VVGILVVVGVVGWWIAPKSFPPKVIVSSEPKSVSVEPKSVSVESKPVSVVTSVPAPPSVPVPSSIPLPKMVTIPAGSFRMGDIRGTGDSYEQPVHTVTVKSFEMSRHEVTFEEYDYFVEQTGREKPADEGWGRGNRPVINVSWDDATAYADWLSGQTGKQYRLPTEAEWEYAARAGTETDYWWGNTASHEYANYGKDECCSGLVQGKDQWEFTAPVCSFVDNLFRLCDTVGNVWEWTCSEYEKKYNGKELECIGKNRANVDDLLVIRGGSWNIHPQWVRASTRYWYTRVTRSYDVGFRLARM
jgi:formylglycine-generating enzyme required for sulfatase activity